MAQQHRSQTLTALKGSSHPHSLHTKGLQYQGMAQDEASRKIALEHLNRMRPATAGPRSATPSSNLHSYSNNQRGGGYSQHRGDVRQQHSSAAATRGSSASIQRHDAGYATQGGTLLQRRPVDGYLRSGSNSIEWRTGPHPVRHPLGSAHMGLPWWHETGQTNLARPVPGKHAAERVLAGRYHQLLLQGRAQGYHSAMHYGPMVGHSYLGETYPEVHHHHYYEDEPSHHLPPASPPRYSPYADDVAPPPYDGPPPAYHDDWEAAYEDDERVYMDHDHDERERDMSPRGHDSHSEEEDGYVQDGPAPPPPSRVPSRPTAAPAAAKPARKGTPELDPHCPTPLAKFRAALEVQDKAARDAMWTRFDANANGYVSLAECNSGVLNAMINMWGREGHFLYKRYYRSYIRAFTDAKDAAPPRADKDDDYVTKSEFRLLLVYLGLYATWYEVFMAIDGGTEGVTVEDDHRLSVRAAAFLILSPIGSCLVCTTAG